MPIILIQGHFIYTTAYRCTLFALHSAHKTRGINDACNHSRTVYYVLSTIPEQSFNAGFKDESEKNDNNELEPKTNLIMGLYVAPIENKKYGKNPKTNQNKYLLVFICVCFLWQTFICVCTQSCKTKQKKHEKQCGQIKKTIKGPVLAPMDGNQIISSLRFSLVYTPFWTVYLGIVFMMLIIIIDIDFGYWGCCCVAQDNAIREQAILCTLQPTATWFR